MRSRVLAELNADKADTATATAKAAVAQVAGTARALAANQPADAARQIAERSRTTYADPAWQSPLGYGSDSRSRRRFSFSAPQPEALTDQHSEAIQTAAHEVLTTQAESAQQLIDASVESALAAIDAIGPPQR
jgi:hypothetical protein